MRAALCATYGSPEVVHLEELPPPILVSGKVRVSVDAAAVNFPDVLLVANRYQIAVPAPFIPGSEFAGRVIEVAEDVTDVVVGERVIGSTLVGAFAEEVVVAAEALMPVPSGMPQRTAAAFGVAHRTAYHTLRSVARLRRDEELVVLGAGGGVGLATVQLGAALGASITAVASTTEKLEVAASHGAGKVIDHRSGDLRQALRDALPHGADVVVDPVGGDLSEPALRSLRFDGRFVTVGYASGTIPRIPLNLVLLKGIRIEGFQFRDFAARRKDEFDRNERELWDLVDSRGLRPYVGATFPLDEVAEALRHVESGQAIGKVVIDIAGSTSRSWSGQRDATRSERSHRPAIDE